MNKLDGLHKVLIIWLVALTVFAGYLTTKLSPQPAPTSFNEISVERINVVEPDGSLRMVISNKDKIPGIIFEGTEYPINRGVPGMLFFNSEGDEVGGLVFDGALTEQGHQATGGVFFDQFKQDQSVGIAYQDEGGKRLVGFHVWDRPEDPLLPVIKIAAKLQNTPPGPDQDALIQEYQALASSQLAPKRVYLGRNKSGSSVLELSDGEGRPRIVLSVSASGEAKISILDENGDPVEQSPE